MSEATPTTDTTESTSSSSKGTFSGAINSLKEAVADYSSLTITTYTGDLKVLLAAGQKEGETDSFKVDNLDFQKILNKSLEAGIEGNLHVACFNSHRLDGDAVVFRSNKVPDDEMVKLEAAHDAALHAGQETREAIFDLVKGTVGAIFKG